MIVLLWIHVADQSAYWDEKSEVEDLNRPDAEMSPPSRLYILSRVLHVEIEELGGMSGKAA